MNTYKPLVPNNPLKFFKSQKDDGQKFTENEKQIYKLFSNIKKNKFKNWMDSSLQKKIPTLINNKIVYKGKNIYNDNKDSIEKHHYVQHFITKFENILTNNGYTINYNKEFRDTIATFIYKNSKK